MESDLKVGDRVRVCVDQCHYAAHCRLGDVGTIIEIRDEEHIAVEWDELGCHQIVMPTDIVALKSPQFIHHGQEGDTPESITAEVDSVFPTGDAFTVLPTDKEARKAIPITTGVLDYFPAAIAEIAKVSKAGNDQHHPGEPLHWERSKSTDHADTINRHLLERGTLDTDGMRHSAKVAWRALALLQEELEAEGAPVSRGSR